ncbi:MAG TPA: hypothetical protein VGM69_05155 [Chloroflexota bacterium]|jgi:ABC-type glycerol-3-phosphate transport system substrate-binding protein
MELVSRRRMIAVSLGALGAAALAACGAPAAPTAAPAPAAKPTEAPKPAEAQKPTEAPKPAAQAPATAKQVAVRAHMVKKSDVSDWIEKGLEQDIAGWKAKNVNVTLETIPGWTPEYIPKILSMASANQLGDAVWYPPRHRSHIAWGTRYNVVRDLNPLAKGANYDMKQFFAGALEANSLEGKTYWMSYISEPIVPVIAYNKTKLKALGVDEPKDDWTFDDLVTWAKAGTKEGVFGYYRADAGNGPFGSGPYLRQWGVEPTDKSGKKATYLDNKDQFVSALKLRQDLMNVHKVSPSPAGGTINLAELFGGQKVLGVDIWPFRIQIFPATFKDFEIGFVLTPVVKKGDKRRTMLNEHVFGITNASKEPEAAFQFLSWIGGKDMNLQGLIQGQKGPIARADVWSDDTLYEKLPTYRKLKPLMEDIEPDYVVGNFRGEDFDNAFAQAYDAMELNKASPADTANEIQKLCQGVLDKDPA